MPWNLKIYAVITIALTFLAFVVVFALTIATICTKKNKTRVPSEEQDATPITEVREGLAFKKRTFFKKEEAGDSTAVAQLCITEDNDEPVIDPQDCWVGPDVTITPENVIKLKKDGCDAKGYLFISNTSKYDCHCVLTYRLEGMEKERGWTGRTLSEGGCWAVEVSGEGISLEQTSFYVYATRKSGNIFDPRKLGNHPYCVSKTKLKAKITPTGLTQ